MTDRIKRSMAVRPAPIVIEGDRARHPTEKENPDIYNGYGGYYKNTWAGFWGYRITRVTNSVEYRPGLALTKAQVQSLIEDGWTVSVLSKD